MEIWISYLRYIFMFPCVNDLNVVQMNWRAIAKFFKKVIFLNACQLKNHGKLL